MSTLATSLALWTSGFVLGLVVGASSRRPTRRGCNPTPPAPPYSSAAIALRDAQAWRRANDDARAKNAAELYAKLVDPSLGVPWDEGHTQRGNGSGGPTTSKPPIKPRFPPPRTISEDLL